MPVSDKKIISNEEFIEAIKVACNISSLEDFAEKFRLSRTSVEKWITSGKNLPVQAMRRPIIIGIERIKENHLLNRFVSNEEFIEAMKTLSSICPLEEFADNHLLSRTSVNRWFSGKNLPVQGMRLPIIKAIEKMKNGVI